MALKDLERRPQAESWRERSLTWIGGRRADFDLVPCGDDTIELPFEFPDFDAICVHLLTGAGPVFVELVDDQRGVPIYYEAFDAMLDSYMESV